MKKRDFKTGMILHYENGSKGLLLDNEIFLFGKDRAWAGSLSLTHYNEDTLFMSDDNLKLEKVTVATTPQNTNIGFSLKEFMNRIEYHKTIWEVTKVCEMTVAEIERKLGVTNLKVVK